MLHIQLYNIKWLSELKIEKPCPGFTGQTAGGILTKLHRSDQYQAKLCMLPSCTSWLHKMAARTKNRKPFSGFHRPNYWPNFKQTSQERKIPTLIPCMPSAHSTLLHKMTATAKYKKPYLAFVSRTACLILTKFFRSE